MSQTTSESVTVQSYLDRYSDTERFSGTRIGCGPTPPSAEDDADRTRRRGQIPFTLRGPGGALRSVAAGPVVLIFFRFEGCPACNAALQGYQETLSASTGLRAQVVAISPQVAERLGAVERDRPLHFLVAADPEGGSSMPSA